MSDDSLGRRILLFIGGAVVSLAGLVGFFVGANGASVRRSIEIFGLVTIPTTPATLATYGILLSATLITVLYGLVEVASRLEGDP